jgi:hypothetical protein
MFAVMEATTMSNASAVSGDHRRQVHTEVRAPLEAVLIRVVWFVFGVIEVLIGIRFILELLGANSQAGFVRVIYGVTQVFMAPFIAIFSSQRVSPGATVEWSALVAIVVYALVAWGIVALIHAVNPRRSSDTVESVERDEDVRAR